MPITSSWFAARFTVWSQSIQITEFQSSLWLCWAQVDSRQECWPSVAETTHPPSTRSYQTGLMQVGGNRKKQNRGGIYVALALQTEWLHRGVGVCLLLHFCPKFTLWRTETVEEVINPKFVEGCFSYYKTSLFLRKHLSFNLTSLGWQRGKLKPQFGSLFLS